jgi:hypothetical protein
MRHAVALVEALSYKPEGRGFENRPGSSLATLWTKVVYEGLCLMGHDDAVRFLQEPHGVVISQQTALFIYKRCP